MQDKKFLGLLDMLDGGGAGRAGSEFEGGIFSQLLNSLGIRPLGSGRAMATSPRPMPRPPGLGAPPPRPAPTLAPPPPIPGVETSALSPQRELSPRLPLPPSMDEIMAALAQAGPVGPRPSALPPTAYPSLPEIMAMQEAQRRARMLELARQPLMYSHASDYGRR
jgi:hypothetical protein